jgi:hypothetical protein
VAGSNSVRPGAVGQLYRAGDPSVPELRPPSGCGLLSALGRDGEPAVVRGDFNVAGGIDAGYLRAHLEPAATLSDHGKPVGLHFKGPIWVSTVDGSEVGAAPVATVNQDGGVPELLLKANQTQGEGTFSRVTYVQRLRTQGGVAPSGMCPDGAQQALPYTAVYRFWTASG